MAGSRLTDVDRGLGKFSRDMRKLAREPTAVKVGILAGGAARGGAGGATNVEIAVVHEFGSPGQGIPERSFLRSTADANRSAYLKLLERAARQVVAGKISTEQAFGLVGARAAADVKARIQKGNYLEPIKPATVAARKRRFGKASTRPLVATGQLVNSITWALVRPSEASEEKGGR